jgi:hypothetical protein
MKNIIRIVLTQEDIEKIVKGHIQTLIPKEAKIFYKHDRKWEEFSSYRKENEECIMIEFSLENVEKEKEKEMEIPTGEQDWNAEDVY